MTGRVGLVGERGFLGSAIVDAAEASDVAVEPVDMPRIDGDPIADTSVASRRWCDDHIAEFEALVGALETIRVVLNAAGAAEPDSTDWRRLWSSNALLPAVLWAACRRAGVERLVHLSSAAVQGGGPVLDETDALRPETAYGRSKAAGEAALLGASESADRPEVVIYRPTSVLSPHRPTTRRLVNLASGRWVPVNRRDVTLPLALVQNVAAAALELCVVDGPPAIVLHPSEGMTVRGLLAACGGRAVSIPGPLVAGALAVGRGLSRVRPAAAGRVRRVELFLRGQESSSSWLSSTGWQPPYGRESYRSLAGQVLSGGERQRVAYVITRSDTIAGAQVHVRDLSEAIGGDAFDVRVFVGGDGPLVKQLIDRGVDVQPLRRLERSLGPTDVLAFFEMRRALADFRPALVSTHSSKAGLLGRLAARSLGVPALFTAHGWAFGDGIPQPRRSIYAGLELLAAPLTTRIICVSRADLRLAQRFHVGSSRTRRVVWNGVHDVPRDRRADPSRQPPLLVMIARLEDQKDHPLLLRTLASVRAPFRVRLIGDGPNEDGLRLLIDQLDLAERVELMGLRHDVDAQLAEAQLYVLASRWEGLPRSILEALRAGLPVIATDTGGVGELVDDSNGILVQPASGPQLRAALDELLSDPERRSRMGVASRRRYEEHFTFDRVLRETRSIYDEVIRP